MNVTETWIRFFNKKNVGAAILSTTLLMQGCLYPGHQNVEVITLRLPEKWSRQDCLTLMVNSMSHNLYDQSANVQVIVTPYYPTVVAAINQVQRMDHSWTSSETQYNMNELLKGATGLYVDRKHGRFVNSSGNYFKAPTDFDSLLHVVTLRNKGWPCAVPTMNAEVALNVFKSMPISAPADWLCYIPDISDIGQRFFFLNEEGRYSSTLFCLGKKEYAID